MEEGEVAGILRMWNLQRPGLGQLEPILEELERSQRRDCVLLLELFAPGSEGATQLGITES